MYYLVYTVSFSSTAGKTQQDITRARCSLGIFKAAGSAGTVGGAGIIVSSGHGDAASIQGCLRAVHASELDDISKVVNGKVA